MCEGWHLESWAFLGVVTHLHSQRQCPHYEDFRTTSIHTNDDELCQVTQRITAKRMRAHTSIPTTLLFEKMMVMVMVIAMVVMTVISDGNGDGQYHSIRLPLMNDLLTNCVGEWRIVFIFLNASCDFFTNSCTGGCVWFSKTLCHLLEW